MAYFLPSYFQKRLLRFALTRLDFIDTDALDLDDLDISLGQRSVIELKNVGVRVEKLIERLHIPPAVVLKDAAIRQLSISIPADLHASGIVVSVNGIEMSVDIQEQRPTTSSTNTRPSHHGVVGGPRPVAAPAHDPGGKLRTHESIHVIPSSRDLANSFLETEPRHEKAELEAALHTQSQYVTESIGSLDETGLGNPGGFSLPSFVADFFAGVADRLEVQIQNLQVLASLLLPSEGPLSETVKIMLRVGKISLKGLSTGIEQAQQKRCIEISGLEVLLLSEPDTFSHHSTSSSPRLAKSRSKVSSTMGSDGFSQFESPDIHFASARLDQSTLSDQTPSELHLDSHTPTRGPVTLRSHSDMAESALLLDSQLLMPSASQDPITASRLHAMSGSNYRSRIDATIDSSQVVGKTSSDHSDEDLSESKLFSHDEAASMYMSAISHDSASSGMPGGWTSTVQQAATATVASSTSDTMDPTCVTGNVAIHTGLGEPGSSGTSPTAQLNDEPAAGVLSDFNKRLAKDFPTLLAKRLVNITQIALTLPARFSADEPEVPKTRGERRLSSSRVHTDRRARVSSEGKTDNLADSLMSHSVSMRHNPHDFVVSQSFEYEVAIGTISVNLDLSISRILIKAASIVQKILPASGDEQSSQQQHSDILSLSCRMEELQINLFDKVPEVLPLGTNITLEETCLLRFTLSKLHQEILRENGHVRQKITVQSIELGQSTTKYLYFTDSIHVQNSIATSTMVRPYDLVVLNIDNRFDVQLKPVHVVIDLLQVDNILSRGGGLDSLLDLGASVMSTRTIKEPAMKSDATTRQRTVRFDRPAREPQIRATAGDHGPKIDVRLSGARMDLVGSETSLQLKTSAIKVVFRQQRARVQIESAVLIGPLMHGSRSAAEINVKLTNTTIIYIQTPEEEDLDRLLSLLTPSKDKYDEENDDIMVDTLIRQRRKGGVLRLSVADIQCNVRGVAWHKHVTRIGDELSKLSAVSKYLPEDDRPGILLFALINKVGLKIDLGQSFGTLHMNGQLFEAAQVSVPSLMAAQVSSLYVRRGDDDMIVTEVIPNMQESVIMGPPMLMCRFIADEMEPTVRVKLSNTQLEYNVSTVIAVGELVELLKNENARSEAQTSPPRSESSQSQSEMTDFTRKIRFSLAVRNSTIGLNPSNLPSKGLFLLSDSVVRYSSEKKADAVQLELRKASILIINDKAKVGHQSSNIDHRLYFEENDQVQDLAKRGYVPVGSISNASATIELRKDQSTASQLVDVEFRNNLLLLETCADSTQTLIQILSALSPPSAPSPVSKYRTEIVSIQDMLASFTGNAFISEPGPELGLQTSQVTSMASSSTNDYSDNDDSEREDEDYRDDQTDLEDNMYRSRELHTSSLEDSYADTDLSQSTMTGSIHVAPVNITAEDEITMNASVVAHSMLDFRTDHFVQTSSVGGTAHRWDSHRNTYELSSEASVRSSPFKLRIRDVHAIWNLFDGYDWQSTRDTISQAVEDIELKAASKQSRRDSRRSPNLEDDESVIGDFLFNSIYIGIPANKDPRDLAAAINQDIGDVASETGSYATGTTITAVQSNRTGPSRAKPKKLRLNRSRQHKMTFELRGVSADILAFPPGSGEVESSVDVRIKMLEIFDHVPTSTWKKFATYMSEAGEREVDTSMIHLELLNVKPVAELSASEIVLKLTVLPLRLHVDQDALDFLTRFFEFKDDSIPKPSTPSVPPFIQRVEVNPIKLRLDFKPKRVDYGGLRSGRTTEFMNFFTLERSNMVLRRVILYGVSGFDRLGIMLNDIWSPDVRRNQLPGVLAGLAPIRSLVDVGSGVKDLIAVPIREYKKDGRIVRSIQKGAIAFAKTTTTELVNLGAKLAIGTQTVLQSAEGMLVSNDHQERDEEKEQISLYADQPLGIVQGLRGAYASLERDLLLAKDAIVAVPGEVMASGSATGAAKAVLRQSPTIILRPAIGATKAVGQTLLGAGNTLDRRNLRRIEDKYKRH